MYNIEEDNESKQKKNKGEYMKQLLIIIFIVISVIIGCILGESVAHIDYLNWLSLGGSFGFENPFTLDLSFVVITFGIWCKINVAGVLALIISGLISPKIFKWLKI